MTQKDSEDLSRPGASSEPADIDPAKDTDAAPATPELDESTVAPADPDVHPGNSEPLLVEPLDLEQPVPHAESDVGTVQPAGAEFADDMIAAPITMLPEAPAQTLVQPVTYVADLAPQVTPRGWSDTSQAEEDLQEPGPSDEDLAPVFEPDFSKREPTDRHEAEAESQDQSEPASEPEPEFQSPPQPMQWQAPPEPAPEPSAPTLLAPETPQSPPPAAREPEIADEPLPRPEPERREAQWQAPPEPAPEPSAPTILAPETPQSPPPVAHEPAIADELLSHQEPERQEAQWQAPPVSAVFQQAPTRSDRFDLDEIGQTDDRWVRAKQIARTGLRYAGYAVAGYFAVVFVLILLYRFINPPASALMVAQALTGTDVRQEWVSLDEISPALVRAVIVSEDWTFCEHYGIDIKAIEQAIERSGNGIPRGASTISMQTTKNLFLWNAKSYIRKIIELPLTLSIELVWPKHRILEIYLNVAEWGPGIFGAEAAAQYHFNKPASRLGEREAAQLAASLPNPIIREAGDPGPRTARKATVIQSRMRNAGDAAQCVLGARR